jgi:hypothetical protein
MQLNHLANIFVQDKSSDLKGEYQICIQDVKTLTKIADPNKVISKDINYRVYNLDDGKKTFARQLHFTNDLTIIRPVLHRKKDLGIYLELVKIDDDKH